MRDNGKSKHVSVEASDIPQPTKCVHCSRTFPFAVPIVGAPKDSEYYILTGQLAQHLVDKHPLEAKKAVEAQMIWGMGISTIMCLRHFDSTDEGLTSFRDLVRHRLHEFSTKHRISDATIEQKVKALCSPDQFGLSQWDVIQLVKDVRDILEEKGMYPIENVVSVR
jgi:hypothetical protein